MKKYVCCARKRDTDHKAVWPKRALAWTLVLMLLFSLCPALGNSYTWAADGIDAALRTESGLITDENPNREAPGELANMPGLDGNPAADGLTDEKGDATNPDKLIDNGADPDKSAGNGADQGGADDSASQADTADAADTMAGDSADIADGETKTDAGAADKDSIVADQEGTVTETDEEDLAAALRMLRETEERESITVKVRAQEGFEFLYISEELAVTDGMAEKYGFANAETVTGGTITALDVLVAAHAAQYADAFTAETASSYLTMKTGNPQTMFKHGESGKFSGFAVNHDYPMDAARNGYSVYDAPISDGDVIDFFYYEDPSGKDYLTWFADAQGNVLDRMTVKTDAEFTLKLKGYMYMSGYANPQAEDIYSNENGMMSIYCVDNMQTSLGDMKSANGIKLSFSESGTYCVTAQGFEKNNSAPIIPPLIVITVQENKWNPTHVGDYDVDVPANYENEISLSSYYVKLKKGDTYTLQARRLMEIVPGDTAGAETVVLPEFRYSVISGSGDSVTVQETTANYGSVDGGAAVITAVKPGVSVVQVTYEAVTASGKAYGAISPVNTGLCFVYVTDGEGPQIKTSMDRNREIYNTVYTEGTEGSYSFTASAPGSESFAVKADGKKLEASADGVYTAPTKLGSTVIELSAADTSGNTSKEFYIIKTKKVAFRAENMTNGKATDAAIEAGDTVRLKLAGLTMPVHKLATIYNPQFKPNGTVVEYKDAKTGSTLRGQNAQQYDLKDNWLDFAVKQPGQFTLTGGNIYEKWWGKALGEDRTFKYRDRGNSDPEYADHFSTLPDYTIEVGGTARLDKEDLNALIAKFEKLTADDYTANTFNALADALTKAKAASESGDVVQKDVDQAASDLAEAGECLLAKADSKKETLEELIARCEAAVDLTAKYHKYTVNSVTAFKAAIEAAKTAQAGGEAAAFTALSEDMEKLKVSEYSFIVNPLEIKPNTYSGTDRALLTTIGEGIKPYGTDGTKLQLISYVDGLANKRESAVVTSSGDRVSLQYWNLEYTKGLHTLQNIEIKKEQRSVMGWPSYVPVITQSALADIPFSAGTFADRLGWDADALESGFASLTEPLEIGDQLPLTVKGLHGSVIYWSSDNEAILSSDGKTTAAAAKDTAVKLTAALKIRNSLESTGGWEIAWREFVFVVKGVPGDTATLSAVVAQIQAEGLQEADYTAESWAAFRTALNDAKSVVANNGVTQQIIDSALAALQSARGALAKKSGSSGDSQKPDNSITVTFRLIGAKKASSDVNYAKAPHDNKGADYVTWIATKTYRMDKGAKVYDLFMRALDEAGIQAQGQNNNYVSAIYAPGVLGGYRLAEFTNGNGSGWMYTINGAHSNLGLQQQLLSNGDKVVWHYVNDWTYETRDGMGIGGGSGGSSGDSSYWDKWLEAPDVNPGSNSIGTSSGGGGSSSVTGSEATVTASGGSGGGTAAASLTTDKAKELVKEAVEKLTSAKADAAGEVKVKVETAADASGMTLTLKTEALKAVADVKKLQLSVESPLGTVTFDAKTLTGLTESMKDGQDVILSMSEVKELSKTNQEIVGDHRVFDLTLTVGGAAVHQFGGSITVALQYSPKTGEDVNGLMVYHLGDDGVVTEMKDAKYDAARKGFVFTTNHFSLFYIAKAQEPKAMPEESGEPAAGIFTDVQDGDWFAGHVRYVYENEIMKGTSADPVTFSPDAPLTRAMAVTTLWNMGKAGTASAQNNPFSDIPEGAWYTDAVKWAADYRIVSGVGAGRFAPAERVSRQDLAVMMLAYAKAKGIVYPETRDYMTFADDSGIADYAKTAVQQLNKAGIMNGKPENLFDPGEMVTRAEFAAMIHNLGAIGDPRNQP